MGKVRRFLPVIVLFLFVQRPAIGQQPLHWDATIDSAKAAAAHSNRLVLVFFCAGYCGPCHRMENDLRNQPGAVAALETNFVPVKINYEYYPNTAKQYGITRLPTTVILSPNARGDVLAVIPEYMPVDDYLSKLNKVAADAKRHDAGVFAQIQASPPVGSPAVLAQPPVAGPAPPANPAAPGQVAGAAGPVQSKASPASLPVANVPGAAAPDVAAPPANGGANPVVAMATGPGLPGSGPLNPQKPPAAIKRPPNPPLGLDGFCPVQLVDNSRWQPGKKTWGVIHRGRIYLFAGVEEQLRFRADPDRYAPVRSGDDVVLLLEQGHSISGYRQHGLRYDGHVYLFANEGTLEKFRSNPRYYADRALQGMHSAVQTAALR